MGLLHIAARLARLCTGSFTIILIAGCANTTWATDPLPLNSDHWQGRIAVKVAASPPQSISAQFDLIGNATAGRMDLSTPLGTTIAQMRWSTQSAEVLSSGESRSYMSMADLTTATLGAELPVDVLFQWLKGEAAPSPGWQVDLTDWPQGRISAQRTEPSPVVHLKILLDR